MVTRNYNQNQHAEFDDDATDAQSDIMTVSDIHTITSPDEVVSLAASRNNNNNNRGPTDPPEAITTEAQNLEADMRTLDSSLFTVENYSNTNTTEVFERHAISKIGGAQTASSGSAAASNPRQSGVPYFRELSAEPPTTPTNDNKTSSLWERAKTRLSPTKSTEDEEDDEHDRPLAVPTDPTTEDEEEELTPRGDEEAANQGPPGMIVVGTTSAARRSKTADPNHKSSPSKKSAAAAAVAAELPPSVWKQKLCGLRADRLVVLLLAILLIAVGVIVGAIIISNRNDSSNNNSSTTNRSNAGDVVELTRTPTSPSPTGAPRTLSPSTSPAPSDWPEECGLDDPTATFGPPPGNSATVGRQRDCAWLAEQNADDIEKECQPDREAYNVCLKTCRNCQSQEITTTDAPISPAPTTEAPITNAPVTSAPVTAAPIVSPTPPPATVAPTAGTTATPTLAPWNVAECGGDSETGTFFAGDEQDMKDCAWLSQVSDARRQRVCTQEEDAYQLCREACRNCGPAPAPTTAPAVAETIEPISTTAPTAGQIEETNEPAIGETVAPTADQNTLAPTVGIVDAEQELANLLAGVASVSVDELQTGSSSQALAYTWLKAAVEDGIVDSDASDDKLKETFSIATFGFSTESDSWDSNSGWFQSGDVCDWEGISCNNGSVSGISLRSNGLGGELPLELDILSSLDTLILSDNDIEGNIPRTIGNLDNLEEWRMDSNNFSGEIPDSIGGMEELRIWYLERNPDIEGEMPDEIAQLGNLEELSFYYTGLTGELTSDICRIDSLEVLILDCKQVTSECWTRCFYRCGGDTGVEC